MKLHPFMVEAIYLRMFPSDKIVKDDGKIFWFCPSTSKYLWKYSVTLPKYKQRHNIYEARGLLNWWNMYLKMLEQEQDLGEEGLPY